MYVDFLNMTISSSAQQPTGNGFKKAKLTTINHHGDVCSVCGSSCLSHEENALLVLAQQVIS